MPAPGRIRPSDPRIRSNPRPLGGSQSGQRARTRCPIAPRRHAVSVCLVTCPLPRTGRPVAARARHPFALAVRSGSTTRTALRHRDVPACPRFAIDDVIRYLKAVRLSAEPGKLSTPRALVSPRRRLRMTSGVRGGLARRWRVIASTMDRRLGEPPHRRLAVRLPPKNHHDQPSAEYESRERLGGLSESETIGRFGVRAASTELGSRPSRSVSVDPRLPRGGWVRPRGAAGHPSVETGSSSVNRQLRSHVGRTTSFTTATRSSPRCAVRIREG